MSRIERYYQCRLENNDLQQVAWIPERGAIKGVHVELVEDSSYWKVIEVYEGPLTEAYIREKQRMDRASLLSIK